MAKLIKRNSSNSDELLDIETIGSNVNILSTTIKSRFATCPGCNKTFIFAVDKTKKYMKCTCGSTFKIERRWFD